MTVYVGAQHRACNHCGTSLEMFHPKRQTCSNACMVADWKARNQERVREQRERELEKKRNNRKAPTPIPCAGCSTMVQPPKRHCPDCVAVSSRRYSLESARRKHNDSPRQCGECQATFIPVYGDKRRTYCSDACLHKACKRTSRLRGKARKRSATVERVNPNRVFARDGWRCHLCGKAADATKRGTYHPNAPELDHILPLSKGGEHSYANTACAHRKCNAAKSDRIIGQPSLFAA